VQATEWRVKRLSARKKNRASEIRAGDDRLSATRDTNMNTRGSIVTALSWLVSFVYYSQSFTVALHKLRLLYYKPYAHQSDADLQVPAQIRHVEYNMNRSRNRRCIVAHLQQSHETDSAWQCLELRRQISLASFRKAGTEWRFLMWEGIWFQHGRNWPGSCGGLTPSRKTLTSSKMTEKNSRGSNFDPPQRETAGVGVKVKRATIRHTWRSLLTVLDLTLNCCEFVGTWVLFPLFMLIKHT